MKQYTVTIPVLVTIDAPDEATANTTANAIIVTITDKFGAKLENEAEEGVFIDEA